MKIEMSSSSPYKEVEERKNSWKHVTRHDVSNDHAIEFHYLTYNGKEAVSTYLIGEEENIIETSEDMDKGFLVRTKNKNTYFTIWIPIKPKVLYFDKNGRIKTYHENDVVGLWSYYPNIKLKVSKTPGNNVSVCASYVKIDDPDAIYFKELSTKHKSENVRYLKSSWFNAHSLSDFWEYFINGDIYDPRTHHRVGKRFKCQQCAFAWWEYFGFLSLKTGKRIYSLLQDEIARSVIIEFGKNNVWRHGYWHESMEIHSRFYLDGIHLLISQYEKDSNQFWLDKARIAMAYVIENLTDRFDSGNIWFLHDSIENKRKHKIKSTLFGKKSSNSLCINTHLQALCVLQRLIKYEDAEGSHQKIYKLGFNGLIQVLEHQPADFLYKQIENTLLLSGNVDKPDSIKSFLQLAKKSIARRLYWKLIKRYPRLVYPGGFTERDLSLSMLSARYHVINMKDLLLLYKHDPNEKFVPYIENGIKFLKNYLNIHTYNKKLSDSLYFIEYLDILKLKTKILDQDDNSEYLELEEKLMESLGAKSLDYYTMDFTLN